MKRIWCWLFGHRWGEPVYKQSEDFELVSYVPCTRCPYGLPETLSDLFNG